MHSIVVYIASPYTLGNTEDNVRLQIDTANTLLDWGLVPIWPLSAHYLHARRPRLYPEWLSMCFALIPKCDVLFRLPGASAGADAEVEFAKARNIPVFYSFNELLSGIQPLLNKQSQ